MYFSRYSLLSGVFRPVLFRQGHGIAADIGGFAEAGSPSIDVPYHQGQGGQKCTAQADSDPDPDFRLRGKAGVASMKVCRA